jgi:hypothetical protein
VEAVVSRPYSCTTSLASRSPVLVMSTVMSMRSRAVGVDRTVDIRGTVRAARLVVAAAGAAAVEDGNLAERRGKGDRQTSGRRGAPDEDVG